MIIPSIARVFAASCASTLTACALLWSTGGMNGVEISHAYDSTFDDVSVVQQQQKQQQQQPPPPNRLGLALLDDDNGVVGERTTTPVSVVGNGRLQPCPYESNCVSSNYREPPNRYVSPLKTFRDRETAFARAVRNLQEQEELTSASSTIKVVDILPRQYYIHVTVPGTSVGSLDDVEILFVDGGNGDNSNGNNGGIVHLRCIAKVTLPPPPFCLQKNCINGNMDQRRRIETIARTLGLPAADQTQMQESAKWTPIFFNSDRVPGFEDDDEL